MNSRFLESDNEVMIDDRKKFDISHIGTKKERTEFIRNYVNNEVSKLHISSPNSNCPIYELFSDGTVIQKKDSNEEILFYEIVKPNTFFKFPINHEKYEGITYGLLSYDDCVDIRKIMDDLLLQV